MAKKNRDTLKKYFQALRMPSQEDFSDLIDSMLNIMDEGFDKSAEEGLKISQLGDSGKLVSLLKDFDEQNPTLFIRIDQNRNLIFGGGEKRNILFLIEKPEDSEEAEIEEKIKIGINKKEPEWELDVGGVVRAEGRIGAYREGKVNADGKWYDITDTLSGCHALEVMAGVGGEKRKGRYALMYAYALNTFNPQGFIFNFLNLKKRIRCHNAYYRSRSDRLKLRWMKKDSGHEYVLQIKSRSDYGKDENGKNIQIKYQITRLWFDEDMSESRP